MRLNSLDTVRGFAIFAMIIAHTNVFLGDGVPRAVSVLIAFLNDAASPLFALVIGVTVGYQLRNAGEWSGGQRGKFAMSWGIKSLVLVIVGLLLGIQFSGTAVVLDYLGVMMLVATPFLFLPTGWLIGGMVVCLGAAPLVNEAVRNWAITSGFVSTPLDPASLLLHWTALGPSYRLTNLLPMVLLGIILARWQLGHRRRTDVMLMAGMVLFVASLFMRRYEEAMTGVTVSGSYGDEARDLGLSLLAYAIIMLLGDYARDPLRRVFNRLTSPLTDMGTMAFTIYCLHVVILMMIWASLLAGEETWLRTADGFYRQPAGLFVMVGLVAVCAAFAMLWRRFLGVGLLERVIGVLSFRHPPASLFAVRGDAPADPGGSALSRSI